MAKLTVSTVEKLADMAQKGMNLLMTGAHGIGKTTLFYDLCQKLGLRGAYINVPSSDYFVDWLGIPSPETEPETIRTLRWFSARDGDRVAEAYARSAMGLDPETAKLAVEFVKSQAEQVSLRFLRPKRLEGVEFVFFDEINREADPRFLDSCMEMVQFKRVNGEPLPDLKLVWAAQNPPNDVYKVKELDVPLVDKFSAHVFVEGNPEYSWYCSKGYDPHTVACVIAWYNGDLNSNQRQQVSPRTLENIMRLVDSGVDPDFGLLTAMQIPAHMLKAKLAKCGAGHRYANLDLPTIAADPLRCIEFAKQDHDFCAYYTDLVMKHDAAPSAIVRTVAVFLALPFEFQSKCFSDSDWTGRMLKYVGQGTHLPSNVMTVPGFQNFVEMLRQFQ